MEIDRDIVPVMATCGDDRFYVKICRLSDRTE